MHFGSFSIQIDLFYPLLLYCWNKSSMIKLSKDNANYSLNGRYQRMKALQVQKEKILHEMFLEDLDKQKEEALKIT